MAPEHALAQSVRSCKVLMARYLSGFNSLNHTRQAPGMPNHVAWTLGHCALTMHRAAAQFDAADVPDTDFSPGECTPASDDPNFCYALESIAFGSTPIDDAALYPAFERCVQIYDDACERLAQAIAAIGPDTLTRTVPWGKNELTGLDLITRMIFHNGMHTGQIADLRRALGMPSIFT